MGGKNGSTGGDSGPALSPEDAVQCLTPSTIETLDAMAAAPAALINATLAIMPTGSRIALYEMGIATMSDELTLFGRAVLDYLLAQRDN